MHRTRVEEPRQPWHDPAIPATTNLEAFSPTIKKSRAVLRAPAEGDSMAAPESQFTRPVRILFADGNDDLRDYVKRQMGGLYEVDLASDGKLP